MIQPQYDTIMGKVLHPPLCSTWRLSLMSRKIFLLISACMLFATGLQAEILTVSQNGSRQFSTIGDAISSASNGDLIRIEEGIYNESLLVNKSLTIEAATGNPVTALDGDNSHHIMIVEGNIEVTLRGLTFSNGYSDDAVALLIWKKAQVIVENCVFEDNYATGSNAVHVRHNQTSASFYRCDFVRNGCGLHSAALSMSLGGNLLVEDCFFAYNTSNGVSGAVNIDAGTFDFHGNLFLHNSGSGEGAMVIEGSASGSIANNTFHNNSGSGAVRINEHTTFQKNIVTSTNGGPGLISSSPGMRYFNLYFDNNGGPIMGSTLAGNEVVADPYYCDFSSALFTLCETSPALGHNNTFNTIGAFGEGCNFCGIVTTQDQTFGGFKSLYR